MEVSIGRAAQLLHCSKDTVRRWAKAGKINVIRTEGNHRRFDLDELQIAIGSCSNLSGSALGFWKANAPHLQASGRLTDADVSAFWILCKTVGLLHEAYLPPAKHTEIVSLTKSICSQMKAFCMTPESRLKMKVEPPQQEDEFGLDGA